METNSNDLNLKNSTVEDEFDLGNLVQFIIRNKKVICIFPLLSLFCGIFYSLTIKKTWEGQFRIVLENQSALPNINPAISRIANIPSPSVITLKTEVSILNSPSVLMPIYEFATSDKQDILSSDKFDGWKKNLSINKERNTSVVSVFYRDKNKEKVIPVLEKLSNSYQEYSGRRIKREQLLTSNYLKDQISLFKEKSSDSLRELQEFGVEQDIFLDGLKSNNLGSNLLQENISENMTKDMLVTPSNFIQKNINIERNRVEAANEIRLINVQLKKIAEINDPEKLQYIGSTITALRKEGLPQKLEDIEGELVELRSKYTDEDRSITQVLEKRKILIDLLKNRSINYLKAAKLEAEARLEASIRPKGVLLKYKELIRVAERDEKTLIKLENQLRALELSAAKKNDPWEIITQPTMFSNPVSPSKTKIGFLFFSLGVVFSIIYSFYKEKKSNIIFDLHQLEKLLSLNFIKEIKTDSNLLKSDKFLFLKEYINKQQGDIINLIMLKDLDSKKVENLRNFLIKTNKDEKQIKIISSPEEFQKLSESNINILVTPSKNVTYEQITTIKKYMKLFDFNLLGLFAINDDN